MELKDIRAFVCVPGVGKTYMCKQSDRFIDFDEIKFRYKYGYENATDEEIEHLKGNHGKTLKDDSIEYIGKLIDKYYYNTDKILLFAPNAEIVEMIYQKHIPYCLVFHSKDCVEEIRNRMKKRGNQKNFIDSMLDPIDRFYEASITDTRPAFKIELHQGEYLSDKISFLCKEKEKQ